MRKTYTKLFQYDSWANSRLLTFLESHNIKDDQIQKLFSHILNAEYVWLSRVSGKPELLKPIWEVYSFGRITEMCDEISKLYIEFINSVSSEDWDKIIEYKTSQGQPFTNTVQDILNQVVGHGNYHRGQINRLIRQKNIDPPLIDYIIFVRS